MKVSSSRAAFFWFVPLLGAVIVTVVFVAWGLHSIAASRSSTAAVGYIFLPFYAAGVAVASFAVFWAVIYSFCFCLERLRLTKTRLTSTGMFFGAVLILLATVLIAQDKISRHTLLVAAEHSVPGAEMIDRALATHDLQVLARLAKNPNTSVPDLLRIFNACNSNVAAANPPEYIVLYSLAHNAKTPSEVLAVLSKCQAVSIRVAVATNPNTPIELLPALARDEKAMVRTWVTTNPNISEELLGQLAKDDDRITRSYAESNLRRRVGSKKEPVDVATQQMMDLGQRAASGDLQAIDAIREQHQRLYQDIDYKRDAAKLVANFKLMHAAFDILGSEAATNAEAMKALKYANSQPELRRFTTDAFGQAAAKGNSEAMNALLNYKENGWLLSSTVGAMKYPAGNNQPQAVDFLIAILNDPRHRPLSFIAKQALRAAAEKGNEKAKEALAASQPLSVDVRERN